MKSPPLCSLSYMMFAITAGTAFGSTAYISNCCSHPSTVAVFQTSNAQQIGQVAVGRGAFQAVYSPDGEKVYVSNTNSQSVSVLRAGTGHSLATIAVGYAVQWLAISADGSKLYAESFDSANSYHLIAINTPANVVTRILTISDFAVDRITLSPDGNKLYTIGSTGLYVIDASTLKVTKKVPVQAGVSQVATPDGKYLFVATLGTTSNSQQNVIVLDTTTYAVVTTIPLPADVTAGFMQITPDGSQVWLGEFPFTSGATPRISVISTSTYQMHTIPLPSDAAPGAIVFSPDQAKAYLPVSPSEVDALSVSTGQILSRITAPGTIFGIAISPDGTRLLAPSSGTAEALAVDVSSEDSLGSVPVGAMNFGNQLFLEYGAVAVSPDGARAYVTDFGSAAVAVIDTLSKKLIRTVPVGQEPLGVVVSPGNSKVYVANSLSISLSVINAETFDVDTVALPAQAYPSAIAITPDGRRLYVAENNFQPDFGRAPGWVFVIDTNTLKVVNAIRILYPMALTVSPDGQQLYVLGGNTDTLYTVSTLTNQITGHCALANAAPSQPVTGGIAVTPDGKLVFASDGFGTSVYEVDVTHNQLIKTIPAGKTPGTLAVTPDGSQVWVSDYSGTSVSVISVASGTVTMTIPLSNQSYGIAFGPR